MSRPKTSEQTSRWTEITPGATVRSSCGSCPPRAGTLRWTDNPDPGFGMLALLRDGTVVAERIAGWGSLAAVRDWRRWARREPDHTWIIQAESPMTGVRYARQPSGRWIATHRSIGFG